MKKLVVGISGATGAIYGIRLLEVLRELEVETHLVVSEGAARTIRMETQYEFSEVTKLATHVYDIKNVGASIASGSFPIDGMAIVPCSIKSLSALANSYNDNLLIRAADVNLKEKRKVVVMVRETPLHVGHLRLMMQVAEAGGVILPPMPAFYHQPRSLQEIIDQTIGKVLDQFGLDGKLFSRWEGSGILRSVSKKSI
ncbi:MAG: UbiX family flavin prenyltransferase [Thermincola sp.]|jgi:4-hydroxy-3-polyprenylbenzoate decarboxylase|nr:UbiX family flavin prenyltransferase [Thermincola sp.]MDT3703218.1 UbiX family flavin prenyltransferase [Thermincola sp.]